MTFFEDAALISELKAGSNLNLDYVAANHSITTEALDAYYKFAKFKYECGIYSDAEDMLGNYLSLTQSNTPGALGALWGRLACRILQAKWSDSNLDLVAVKDAIEIRNITPIDQVGAVCMCVYVYVYVCSLVYVYMFVCVCFNVLVVLEV